MSVQDTIIHKSSADPADQTIEIAVSGMDCSDCARRVSEAVNALSGVKSVDVLFASGKAVVRFDPSGTDKEAICNAITERGYSVGGFNEQISGHGTANASKIMRLFGLIFGTVLFLVVLGEWLGLIESVTAHVPFPLGLAVVIAGGYPVFVKVIKAALSLNVTSHTLMTFGVVASLLIGQWATAAVIVLFMRVGDYVESYTTQSARSALRELTSMAPETANVIREGEEVPVPVGDIKKGEIVITRPGEKIPVDGEVISGNATVDQSAITGESMPVDIGQGSKVYAATIAQLGRLMIRTESAGEDTTFSTIVRMVEQAEANKSDIQRFADRFSGYYLPVVILVGAMTYIIRQDPVATAAVFVVACSCAFALATPVAILASVGSAAKKGLLIKGGKYLELIQKADVILIDKTGTLTYGKPEVTDILTFGDNTVSELTALAASAELYSEHPLAKAVVRYACNNNIEITEPEDFSSIPGVGVKATLNGSNVIISSPRALDINYYADEVNRLESEGKTVFCIEINGKIEGAVAVADTIRSDAAGAIEQIRKTGLTNIELITGDNERTAGAIAGTIGVGFRANLLPQDKIDIVREYQAAGHRVIMIGDGVNDAPALAQADVGIAMGVAGTDVAIEASDVAIMGDDWNQVPVLLGISRNTMGVIKGNLGFTAVFNLAGLSLAAMGLLPPVLAAAAQSIPDLGILANSSRLLK